jgi:uncharacterized protein (DUF486 family)
MTIARYGRWRYRKAVIARSRLIVFAEYCFEVPASSIGNAEFTAFHMKINQEVITLGVSVVFPRSYLGEGIKRNHAVSFLVLIGAVAFAF